MADLLSLVKELNSLNFKELSEKVIKDSEVEWCLSELQDMLEADCVPVVRCKDCKNYSQNPYSGEDESLCMCWSDWIQTEPDDFCSYGEREEGTE